MPVIPTRFPVGFGEVFPEGVFILGVEPTLEFSDDRHAPKRQEPDKDTNQLVWTVRALDANEQAARFGAEVKVNAKGRVAFSFRATGMRAPAGAKSGKTAPPSADTPARNAA